MAVSALLGDVSGRGGSGSLGSGRSAGCAIGEDRTSPRLGAMAGIRSDRIPGGLLPLLGSPDRPGGEIRAFKIFASFSGGGQGSAPTPFATFLASMGTCAGIYVLGFCKKLVLYLGVCKCTSLLWIHIFS